MLKLYPTIEASSGVCFN